MDLLGHRRGRIEGCREGVLWLWGKGGVQGGEECSESAVMGHWKGGIEENK